MRIRDRVAHKIEAALQFDTTEPLDTLPDIVDVIEADMININLKDDLEDLMDTREGKLLSVSMPMTKSLAKMIITQQLTKLVYYVAIFTCLFLLSQRFRLYRF